MSGNNRMIQVPGELPVNFKVQVGPNVHPAVITAQGPAAINVLQLGGLLKLEHVACYVEAGSGARSLSASEVVDRAQAILDECHRRVTAQSESAGAITP